LDLSDTFIHANTTISGRPAFFSPVCSKNEELPICSSRARGAVRLSQGDEIAFCTVELEPNRER
jgi:hypothetical protein